MPDKAQWATVSIEDIYQMLARRDRGLRAPLDAGRCVDTATWFGQKEANEMPSKIELNKEVQKWTSIANQYRHEKEVWRKEYSRSSGELWEAKKRIKELERTLWQRIKDKFGRSKYVQPRKPAKKRKSRITK